MYVYIYACMFQCPHRERLASTPNFDAKLNVLYVVNDILFTFMPVVPGMNVRGAKIKHALQMQLPFMFDVALRTSPT